MGATLVSIEDPQESLFIEHNLNILQDSAKSFWIGLYKTSEGEWMWIDNSAVDYVNWKTGMPESDSCVDISSDSGLWNTHLCTRHKSYICKITKVVSKIPRAETDPRGEAYFGVLADSEIRGTDPASEGDATFGVPAVSRIHGVHAAFVGDAAVSGITGAETASGIPRADTDPVEAYPDTDTASEGDATFGV
ncbi:Macrophage mannose receptor 1 [Liparis tanakae]|uniref:Macrophage mannose receptor 1 n=1 Tax=Liparis tanakae TaxID=230148 RepID=A0A4Z2GWM0_9TELE|nr:Macrophage mannose receptor 1 [Liparis tanakae]